MRYTIDLPTVADHPDVVAAREERNAKREARRAAREELQIARKGAEGPEDRAVARRLGAPSEAVAFANLETLERELQQAEESFQAVRARAFTEVELRARELLKPIHAKARRIAAQLVELEEEERAIAAELRGRGFGDAHRVVADAGKLGRLLSHARAL